MGRLPCINKIKSLFFQFTGGFIWCEEKGTCFESSANIHLSHGLADTEREDDSSFLVPEVKLW